MVYLPFFCPVILVLVCELRQSLKESHPASFTLLCGKRLNAFSRTALWLNRVLEPRLKTETAFECFSTADTNWSSCTREIAPSLSLTWKYLIEHFNINSKVDSTCGSTVSEPLHQSEWVWIFQHHGQRLDGFTKSLSMVLKKGKTEKVSSHAALHLVVFFPPCTLSPHVSLSSSLSSTLLSLPAPPTPIVFHPPPLHFFPFPSDSHMTLPVRMLTHESFPSKMSLSFSPYTSSLFFFFPPFSLSVLSEIQSQKASWHPSPPLFFLCVISKNLFWVLTSLLFYHQISGPKRS